MMRLGSLRRRIQSSWLNEMLSRSAKPLVRFLKGIAAVLAFSNYTHVRGDQVEDGPQVCSAALIGGALDHSNHLTWACGQTFGKSQGFLHQAIVRINAVDHTDAKHFMSIDEIACPQQFTDARAASCWGIGHLEAGKLDRRAGQYAGVAVPECMFEDEFIGPGLGIFRNFGKMLDSFISNVSRVQQSDPIFRVF